MLQALGEEVRVPPGDLRCRGRNPAAPPPQRATSQADFAARAGRLQAARDSALGARRAQLDAGVAAKVEEASRALGVDLPE